MFVWEIWILLIYCHVLSLAYSVLDNEINILIPQYGIVTYQVTDEVTYNKLAMISTEKRINMDTNILHYQNSMKKIVEFGVYMILRIDIMDMKQM